MRKRRILSLLLAVAVTATMLIAVPLTASAEGDTTYIWDFTSKDIFGDNTSIGKSTSIKSTDLSANADILSNPGAKINFDDKVWAIAKIDGRAKNALAFNIPEAASATLTIELGASSSTT